MHEHVSTNLVAHFGEHLMMRTTFHISSHMRGSADVSPEPQQNEGRTLMLEGGMLEGGMRKASYVCVCAWACGCSGLKVSASDPGVCVCVCRR